jgi:hypothetical protein
MTTIRRTPLLLAATVLLAACGKDEPPAGVIPPDKFVAANVAVRSLPDDASAEQRAAALRKQGVTDKQLRAWVTVHSRDPESLAKAWEQIAFKVDSLSNPTPHVPPPPSPEHSPMPGTAHAPPPRPLEMADSVRPAPKPPRPTAVSDPRRVTRPRPRGARVQ